SVGALQDHGAGAAIALRAALLGAPEAAMLAQPVEQGRHRRQAVELHRLVVQDKMDTVRHANDCARGVLCAQAFALPCGVPRRMMHSGCQQREFTMDPYRFGYSPVVERPKLSWPTGARVAVWVCPNIEHY